MDARFVHGPGGVGKTTRLDRCAEIASDSGVQVVRLDLASVETTPEAVLAELAANLGLSAHAVPDATMAARPSYSDGDTSVRGAGRSGA